MRGTLASLDGRIGRAEGTVRRFEGGMMYYAAMLPRKEDDLGAQCLRRLLIRFPLLDSCGR